MNARSGGRPGPLPGAPSKAEAAPPAYLVGVAGSLLGSMAILMTISVIHLVD